MLVDEKFLFKILTGKITKCFYKVLWENNHTKKRVIKHGEHNIHLLQRPKSKSKYGVVDVTTITVYKMSEVPEEFILQAGYKSRDEFLHWCLSWFNVRESDEIALIEFELHNILRNGKEIFASLNIPIPKVRW